MARTSSMENEQFYKDWMKELGDALKREKQYRKLGKQSVDLYEAKNPERVPFSILYSNVETLTPAVYSTKPIPIVTRRFRDADPMGKAMAEVCTRTLKYLLDVESLNYDTFDELLAATVLDGVITNRGVLSFEFEDEGLGECVYGENTRWDKFLHGYARTWKKVPWIAFELDMTEEELKANFQDIPVDLSQVELSEDSAQESGESKEQLTGVKLYRVYKVWDKTTKKVFCLSAVWPKGALLYVDDPLELVGFFPMPKPLNFMRKVTSLVPTPLYEHYRQQATELNELTRRLKAIVKALKYRGAYNNAVEGIEKVLTADDNEMVPVENVQSMPDGTGMDKLLWTVPVGELAATAQSLYVQREQVKSVIYEITGLSDILRGSSTASETATAQNIKNQWGTLRLKKAQKEVQRFCRDSLSIMMEIAASKFSSQTLAKMTQLPYPQMAQKQQAQMAVQQAQMQAQMTGQPPQIPPQVQQVLSQPSWEEISGALKNDVLRSYKIDIETNSTIDAEASQDKQDIAELMNAVSQFLMGIAPLVEKGAMSMDVAKSMLLTVSRRYNFGGQIEEALEQLGAPQPQGQQEQQAEQQKAQLEMAKDQAELKKIQMETEAAQQEHQNKMQEMAAEMQIAHQELAIKREELQLQQAALGMKSAAQSMAHRQKLEAMQVKSQEKKESENATV